MADITRIDARTQVTASLTDILLDLDRLLPPNEAAPARPAGVGAKPAAAPATSPSPWSQDEVTWSFLKGWSGEIAVGGPSFTARGVALQDFSARIVVADAAGRNPLEEGQGHEHILDVLRAAQAIMRLDFLPIKWYG